MPGSPYTSYIGLAFLALVLVGMADLRLAELAVPLPQDQLPGHRLRDPDPGRGAGHRLAGRRAGGGREHRRPARVGVGGRRPRYGAGVSPDDLDVSEQDPEDHRLTDIEFDAATTSAAATTATTEGLR